MSILDKLISTLRRQCIICRERYPSERTYISDGRLCICTDCREKIKVFKSTAAFKQKRDLKFHVAAFPYEGVLRDAFRRYKFFGEWAYGGIFSSLMCDCLEKLWSTGDFDMIIPVPLSKERLNERGYNQSAILAKAVAERFGAEYSEALFRIRHTKRQSELDAKERAGNVRGAFLADSEKVCGRKILLIDDIYTMGATMCECAETLTKAGAATVAGFTLFGVVEPLERERHEYDFESSNK